MVREVEIFGYRETTSLVSCVVTETFHRTEMLTEPVREPAQGKTLRISYITVQLIILPFSIPST